jgi:hydrogenase nickel incorporation protein HypA/HybF
MHEYSIVQALVDSVEGHARAADGARVRRVRIRIGDLAGVDAGLLASAYELFREGTICAAAPLEIVRTPAEWACEGCRRPIAAGAVLQCNHCGSPARLSRGDDIVLEQIELEVD